MTKRFALGLLLAAVLFGPVRPTAAGVPEPAALNSYAPLPPAQATASPSAARIYLPFAQQGPWYHGAVRFAVIGDYGVCALGEPIACAAQIQVAAMVKSWRPQFIVTTGDNNYPRGKWNTWDANVAPYREYIPERFEPSVGNHDYICSECPDLAFRINFQRELTRQFAKPSNVNPLVRFFVFDSNAADPDPQYSVSAKAAQHNPLPEQRKWLEHGLRYAQACWKLVVMHHPPYSSTLDPGSNTLIQSRSGWAYRQWGAHVVLSGHAHTYERITRPGDFAYIVNGTGGGRLDPQHVTRVADSVAFISDAYGAVRGYADATRLVLDYYTVDTASADAEPELRDTHRIERDCNGPPVPPAP